MVLATGDVFAGFAIEEVIGAGGMGVVYAARHPRMDRLIALKVLHDNLAADRHAHAAFDREASLAARLDHPNIVTVHDRSAPDDPALWLAMRHIRGGDAATLVAGQPGGLAPRLVADLITDAAAALDYAHAEGVLHRDVKPANLLIEGDPRHGQRALLTDFGIARTLDSTVTLSAISASFAYAAPERFAQAPADPRADIYSLGATLFHLLTGRPPFPRADQAAVIGAHLNAPPPAPSETRTDLPVELDAVIATAMAKDPADRYPTCTALAEATRTACKAQSGHATEPSRPHSDAPKRPVDPPDVETVTRESAGIETRASAPPVPVPGPRISRRRLLISGAIATPLAVGAVGAVVSLARDRPPLEVDPSWISTLEGPSAPVVDLAFSPDSTLLAATNDDHSVRMWTVNADPPASKVLRTSTYAVRGIAFSPDSNLVCVANGPYVRRWNTRAEIPSEAPALTVHDTGAISPPIGLLAFNEDGTLLANLTGEGKLHLWDMRTQPPSATPLITDDPPISWVEAMAFNHQDGTLLTLAGFDMQQWDIHTEPPGTKPRPLSGLNRSMNVTDTGAKTSVNVTAFSPDGRLVAAGGDDSMQVWDMSTQPPEGTSVAPPEAPVISLAFNRTGHVLAGGSSDNTIQLWNWDTDPPLVGTPVRGHTAPVTSVAFSPDGTLMASGSVDNTVRLWDMHKLRGLFAR